MLGGDVISTAGWEAWHQCPGRCR